MSGQRGYLIYVTAAATVPITVPITGEAWFETPTWQPDSFNLVGFNLIGTPTFDELFADADGRHPINKIFRLETTGNWVGVRGSDLMTDGAAYLVYADGKSDFMGGVQVAPGRILDFGPGPGTIEVDDPDGLPGDTILLTKRELVFYNPSETGQAVTISQEATSDDLDVFHVVPSAVGLDWETGGAIHTIAPIEIKPGTKATVGIGVHRDWTELPVARESLYKIELDTHYFWLPVRAENETLRAAADDAPSDYVGLWIGDAIVNRVTSITEGTAPTSPTTSNAPLRILLHVDDEGRPSLLSHVVLMQEKSGPDGEAPSHVLVVNDAKIPFFEGIEERRGKRVGRRFSTVAYDMPRRYDREAQAALVAMVASAADKAEDAVTAADIEAFVQGRPNNADPAKRSRPVPLRDIHYPTVPLAGGLGPNAELSVPFERTPEVQTITISASPTGGSLTLTFGGTLLTLSDIENTPRTDPIAFDATLSDVQIAVDKVMGAGAVTAAGTPVQDMTLTFNRGGLPNSPGTLITVDTSALAGVTDDDVVVSRTVATSAVTNPLFLDAFHRSNPFRHAYHPQHGTGININRSMRISFDATQPAGALDGDYEEIITGLAGGNALTAKGRIRLQRLSTVGELQ